MSVRQPQEHCCSGPVNKAMFRDPVCGAKVSATTPFRSDMGVLSYYFCSKECLASFERSLSEPAVHRRSDQP